jgi:hypothetical protein
LASAGIAICGRYAFARFVSATSFKIWVRDIDRARVEIVAGDVGRVAASVFVAAVEDAVVVGVAGTSVWNWKVYARAAVSRNRLHVPGANIMVIALVAVAGVVVCGGISSEVVMHAHWSTKLHHALLTPIECLGVVVVAVGIILAWRALTWHKERNAKAFASPWHAYTNDATSRVVVIIVNEEITEHQRVTDVALGTEAVNAIVGNTASHHSKVTARAIFVIFAWNTSTAWNLDASIVGSANMSVANVKRVVQSCTVWCIGALNTANDDGVDAP